MKMSDVIANMILDMFSEETQTVQIQRNDLAQQIGCVPSQINYVITSRFTPEQGYTIESRRGGGGYILITRASSESVAIMHLVNSVGNSIDEKTANAHIYNLHRQKVLDDRGAKMMLGSVSDNIFKETGVRIPSEIKDRIRANLFKSLLLNYSK